MSYKCLPFGVIIIREVFKVGLGICGLGKNLDVIDSLTNNVQVISDGKIQIALLQPRETCSTLYDVLIWLAPSL